MDAGRHDELKLAYAAGYFDGEGCISSLLQPCAKCKSGHQYVLRLQITSTDYWSLTVFSELFGSEVFPVNRNTESGKQYTRAVFRWYKCGSHAFAPLRAMLPFLRSKHHEANAVINSGLADLMPGKRPSEEQFEMKRILHLKLKELKGEAKQFDYPLLSTK